MTIHVGDHVLFRQKITRDRGQEPVLIDRPARVLQEFPGVGGAAPTYRLEISIPQGPEYCALTGVALDPPIQTHTRDFVELGDGPNQFRKE